MSLRRNESTRRHASSRRRGFTLIESALATVIIGVGVLAMVTAQQALHRKNEWSTHASIAMHLGNEIREMTLNLPRHDPVTGTDAWGPEDNEDLLDDFDDVDDFDGDGDGLIFSSADGNGPINAAREIIPNMNGWAQIVTVQNVDADDIVTAVDDGASEMVRVEVIITFQGPRDIEPTEMTRVSWIAPR